MTPKLPDALDSLNTPMGTDIDRSPARSATLIGVSPLPPLTACGNQHGLQAGDLCIN
jgi:hypothetical protein